jgi:hypothetical protein
MKCLTLMTLLFLSVSVFAQDDKDDWEPYLAQYEKGAGSTLVNMSLKTEAPIKQYPFLVKAGVKINHCSSDGLPEDQEWDDLYAISDKVKAVIDSYGMAKSPGVFTYQCWRTDYYYVKDTANLRAAVMAAFKKYLPGHECKVEIKSDPKWDAYLTFLYPNELIFEYIRNQKIVINLTKAGDKLTKPRKVDHWLYFNTEADRNEFASFALQQHYAIENKGFSRRPDFRFELHLSRTDDVSLANISKITLALNQKAKALNGVYDGWETFVIKD